VFTSRDRDGKFASTNWWTISAMDLPNEPNSLKFKQSKKNTMHLLLMADPRGIKLFPGVKGPYQLKQPLRWGFHKSLTGNRLNSTLAII